MSLCLGDDKLFIGPRETSILFSWFYLVYMIWRYYLSVKLVMLIVKQKIQKKQKKIKLTTQCRFAWFMHNKYVQQYLLYMNHAKLQCVAISMYNNLMGGRHSFVCAYHPAAPGSNPNHTIYAFFNMYYWNCIEKITRINKKRPGLAHFLSMYNKSIYILIPMIAVSLISLPWIDPRQVRSKSCRNSDSPEKLSNRQLVSVVVVVIVVVVVAVSAVVAVVVSN